MRSPPRVNITIIRGSAYYRLPLPITTQNSSFFAKGFTLHWFFLEYLIRNTKIYSEFFTSSFCIF